MDESDELPGRDQATKLGYSLSSSAADGHSASYVKDGITLTIEKHGSSTGMLASMWARIGIVEMEIKAFQFPHPLFRKFEAKLLAAVDAARSIGL